MALVPLSVALPLLLAAAVRASPESPVQGPARTAPAAPAAPAAPGGRPTETVVPNDNRAAGGAMRGAVRELRLVAQVGRWRPNLDVDSTITVFAFGEEGGAARIPGPLLRAPEGTEIRVTVRNAIPDSTVVVHGLRAGTGEGDSLVVPPGATRSVTFRAGAPGTFVYWGSTTRTGIAERSTRDSQLTGAIVIDPVGARPDTAERIFVITVIDLFPDDTVHNKAKEDLFERAINGRSWPHGERLEYAVGDTVRWRWVNGSYLPHPMHLHGFHFRVLSHGERHVDTTYAAGRERLAVTEMMVAGSTFRMDWVPTRAGAWLMHCHMIPHITPWPARPDSLRAHDVHDVARHPLTAMAGLVLGVTTVDRPGTAPAAAPPEPTRRLRILAQQARADAGTPAPRGYVLQRGAEPRADSIEVPGSPLELVRGEPTAITVVNRLREPTTVHWHGMELESVFDGVSGWSRTGGSVAPLLAPGDSFVVRITPPRAGTYMYHTHMDEGDQLVTGLYAPMLVLEPGERRDPATDLVFMIGRSAERDTIAFALNGRHRPEPMTLRAGTRYRLRIIHIDAADPATVALVADTTTLRWRPIAKDGADLPSEARVEGPARLRRLGTGETYDFEWTPARPMDAVLRIRILAHVLEQPIRVR